MKRYLIVIEKAKRNYGAHAPDLPGCGVLGKTVEETVESMKRAIAMHIQGMREDGEPIPEPTTVADYVEVEIPEPAKRKAG